MCFGFWSVEVVPSPKLQFHAVGEPVELSLKYTVRGAVPVLGEPQQFITGFATVVPVTVM